MSTLLFGFLFCLAALGWFLICWYTVEWSWRIYRALRTAKWRWMPVNLGSGTVFYVGSSYINFGSDMRWFCLSFGKRQLILDWSKNYGSDNA